MVIRRCWGVGRPSVPHLRIAFAKHVRHLPARRDELGGIARLVRVERAVAVHDDGVPAASGSHVQFVREMKIEPAAPARPERHGQVQPGRPGQRLEKARGGPGTPRRGEAMIPGRAGSGVVWPTPTAQAARKQMAVPLGDSSKS